MTIEKVRKANKLLDEIRAMEEELDNYSESRGYEYLSEEEIEEVNKLHAGFLEKKLVVLKKEFEEL